MSLLEPHLDMGVELDVDPWTEPFWNAAREHRLVIAQCSRCAKFRSPPTAFCPGCRSQEIDWVELSGEAAVYTFTIVRHAAAPSLADKIPYVIAIVTLAGTGGVKFMTNIVNCTPEDVHVGMTVHVVWDDLDRGVSVPRFGP